jgi:tetratricopeptide (TPR) repeat protein/transglutaminase-like putative cysteine protease
VRIIGLTCLAAIAGYAGSSARASETPLYQPAPAWIVPAPAPDPAKLAKDAPAAVIFDAQQRIEKGRLHSYVDSATRVATPEMLSQLATITIPWAPDKGDLIVHELSILRGDKRIDLLAQGQKFTVLRREQSLEQRELTGILTATMPIEGLQVGDVVRLRVTTTSKDDALGGRVQGEEPIVAAPARVGYVHLALSWPGSEAPRWKIHAEGVTPKTLTRGGYTELSFDLPAPKQPDMPADAPTRFRHPPLFELTTFDSWKDVSKVMAPLYATDGAIAPGSPLAAEVTAIIKADATPLGRAERALELVQDKVRYLAVGMNGGNYVPQKPARTWEVRYGDCKAKTLLLLALLHAMNIEAEPVLAHTELGDFVDERLPSAAAFNHVLVRATIGGDTLWLDGTGMGARLPDIRDTPGFHTVLPVRTAGADLLRIVPRAPARPFMDVIVEADESTSSDLPSVFDAKAVVRGGVAAAMTVGLSELAEKQKREAIGRFFQGVLGEAQIASATAATDTAAGTVTLSARGVVTTPWTSDDRKRKRALARATGGIDFSPDRARPTWKAIPVVAPGPLAGHLRVTVRLPDGGRGFTLEGQPEFKGRVAGSDITRSAHLEGATVVMDERVESAGGEIAAADIAAERDKAAVLRANAPRVVAPETTRRYWELSGIDAAGGTQIKAIDDVYSRAIANDPDEASGYASRAIFRDGIGDRRGALADLTKALALEPSVALYLRRAGVQENLGDVAAAAADAEAARQLDPSSAQAVGLLARLKAERGDLAAGIALLDERIALGGDTRQAYRQQKASLIGEYGDPQEAVKLYDTLVAEKPGSPSLLNGRCWVKGTRSVMLDTALKDCTESIELSSSTGSALDSRAMVWFRMGRYEEALRDLDAVLAAVPGKSASRYLRGVVLSRVHRGADAARDLAIARRLDPTIDKTYGRFGIKPEAATAAAAAVHPKG